MLIVPQKSTFEIQDKMYVFVIDNNNKVKSRPITSKTRMPHFYIIDSGLTKEDRIIYEGIQNVKDGMTIKPQFVEMNEIKADLGHVNTLK